MKRLLILSVTLLALGGMVFAGSESEPEQTETVITAAYESEPGNLNTIVWPTTSDTNITHMVYDCLLVPSESLEMVGQLASDWTVSDDGTQYTFNLREGVKWHDGEAFTADDVAFTYTMMLHPDYDAGSTSRAMSLVGAEEFRAGEADSVEGIEVLDDTTIRFTLKSAYAPFLSDLFIGIIPEHVWGEISPVDWAQNEANRNPIGTGPFTFVNWEQGQYIELAANEDYFGGRPAADRLIIRFGDQNTLLAGFISGAIDIVPVPAAEIETVSSLESAELALYEQLSFYYVGYNVRHPDFANANVRIAMAHAIDKQQIVDTVLGDMGGVQHDIFPNSHWSHSEETPEFPYDPALSRSILEGEGYTLNADGFFEMNGEELSITLEVPTGKREREQTSVLLKQYWEEVGIRTELRLQDFPTLVTKLLPRAEDGSQRPVEADDFDAYILGYGIEADPNEYYSYFHSTTMPPNGYGFCGYDDPEMDRMLDAQLTAIDPEERAELFHAISYQLVSEQVWIPLYYQNQAYAYNSAVTGFNPDFRGFTFTAETWSR